MKKKLLIALTLILSSILFIPNIYALTYYEKVKFNVYFEEDVNTNELKDIIVELADSTDNLKKIVLEKQRNYKLEVEGIPTGDLYVFSVLEENDTLGYYKMIPKIIYNLDNTVTINIQVGLQNNEKYEHDYTKTREEMIKKQEEWLSKKNNEEKTTTTSISTSKTTTTAIIQIPGENVENPEEETTETTTTGLSYYEQKRIEKEKKEREKQKNIKRNNKIGIILYSIIGIIVITLGFYAFIKVINANK